jgi:hypothetical protein
VRAKRRVFVVTPCSMCTLNGKVSVLFPSPSVFAKLILSLQVEILIFALSLLRLSTHWIIQESIRDHYWGKKYIFNPWAQYSDPIICKSSVPTLQEAVFATRIISLQQIILSLSLFIQGNTRHILLPCRSEISEFLVLNTVVHKVTIVFWGG